MTLDDLLLDVEQHIEIKASRKRLSPPFCTGSEKATAHPMARL
jgi:hypothetical protein